MNVVRDPSNNLQRQLKAGHFKARFFWGRVIFAFVVLCSAGTVSAQPITDPALSTSIDTVTGDDGLNIREKADGFSITGKVLDDKSDAMSNASVTVEIVGETLTAAGNPADSLTGHAVENTTPPGERCAGSEGSMRLVDGSDSREGRVEVCADDDTTDSTPARWGVVCDDYWTDDDADVVCKALDFERSEPLAHRFGASYFGAGIGLIWLDDLLCNGDESNLLDCPTMSGLHGRDAIGEHDCRVTEIVGVRCMAAGDPLKPHVNGRTDINHPGEGRRYEPGDTLSVTLTFNEPVVVDSSNGTPTVGLLLGDVADAVSRSARYADGSGTRRLEFKYRVSTADGAFEALRLAANSLATNGGTIRNTDGLDAILAHDSDAVAVERFVQRNLSLSDASAREGAPLRFRVSLDHAAFDAVSVSYRTEERSATAGVDFEAASGTVTFEPGQSEKTVSIVTLDDAHDDGGETVTLVLFDARGAILVDDTATGTIVNSDPMPQAWLARFGRTAADHAVQAIDARLRAGEGENIPGGVTLGSPDWLGNWSAWGRASSTRFDGTDGPLSIEGEVATATLGLDSRFGQWLAGAAVSYSVGEGGYGHVTAAGSAVTSTLASLHPYASFRFNQRFSLWGVLGYGVGELTLQSVGAETAIETGLNSTMAAFGGRGVLRRAGSGLELALVSDALFTNTKSDATRGLMGAQGKAQRLRLMLEGSGAIELRGGGELKPRIEAGLRYDAGDAENGTGVEVGGGLAYAAGRLSVQVDARALLAHRDEDYEEWGVSGAVTWLGDARGHGWSITARSSWGVTASGVESMWNRPLMDDVIRDTHGLAIRRFKAELGYGLAGLRGRGLWYPFIGARADDGGARSVRMGVKLTSGPKLDAAFEIGRHAQPGSATDHTIQLRGTLRW